MPMRRLGFMIYDKMNPASKPSAMNGRSRDRFMLYWLAFATLCVQGQGQSFVVECPAEAPVFPSTSVAKVPAGNFERHDPLVQTQLQQFALDFSVDDGCICTEDIPMDIVYTELPDFLRANQRFNDSECLEVCNTVMPALGQLPGSNRFIAPFLRTVGITDVSQIVLRFLNVPVTTSAPNLQFYLKGVNLNVANAVVLRVVIDSIDNSSAIFYEDTIILTGIDSTPPCDTSNNWTKVTIPLGAVFDSPKFLEDGGSTEGKVLVFQLFTINHPEAMIGIDNVELVGPPYNGTFTPPTFNISDIGITVPFSLIGETAADAFFTIISYIYLVVVILGVVVFHFHRSDRVFMVEKIVVYSWYLVGFMIAIFAITEYLNFVSDLAKLRTQIDEYLLSLGLVLAGDTLDFRTLADSLGQIPIGFLALVLPPIDPEALSSAFEVPTRAKSICEATRFTGGSCAEDLETFAQAIDAVGDSYVGLTVEGQVRPTEDHFIDILLISLIADVVVGAFLGGRLVFDKALTPKTRKYIRWLETTLALTNFAIVLYVLYISLTTPVRYELSLNIIEGASNLALNVRPREVSTLLSSNGEFVVDTSDFGVVDRCFTDASSLVFAILLLGANQIAEVFEPARADSRFETCKLNDVVWDLNDTHACYSIDCSSGVLPITSAEAVESLVNFVYTRVIIGVVLIDVMISLIDLLILPVVARVEPKELDVSKAVEVRAQNVITSKEKPVAPVKVQL